MHGFSLKHPCFCLGILWFYVEFSNMFILLFKDKYVHKHFFIQGVMGLGPNEAMEPTYCACEYHVMVVGGASFRHCHALSLATDTGIIRAGRGCTWTLPTPIFERLTESANS